MKHNRIITGKDLPVTRSPSSPIEQALTNVAGVNKASVNLATAQATVSYNEGKVNVDALQSAVAKVGYKALIPKTSTFEEEQEDKSCII